MVNLGCCNIKVIIFLLIGIGLVSFSSSFAKAEDLRLSYSTTASKPYVFHTDEVLSDGITFRIGRELGDRMQATVQFIKTPRKRVEKRLVEGKVDLHCFLKPEWTKTPEKYVWSVPLIVENTIIISNASVTQDVTKMEDMNNARIGTVLGYHYGKKLDDVFKKGGAKRVNARSEAASLQMLLHDRFEYQIASEFTIGHLIKLQGIQSQIKTHSLIYNQYEVQCAISKVSGKAPEITAVLLGMKNDGFIENITAQYTKWH